MNKKIFCFIHARPPKKFFSEIGIVLLNLREILLILIMLTTHDVKTSALSWSDYKVTASYKIFYIDHISVYWNWVAIQRENVFSNKSCTQEPIVCFFLILRFFLFLRVIQLYAGYVSIITACTALDMSAIYMFSVYAKYKKITIKTNSGQII